MLKLRALHCLNARMCVHRYALPGGGGCAATGLRQRAGLGGPVVGHGNAPRRRLRHLPRHVEHVRFADVALKACFMKENVAITEERERERKSERERRKQVPCTHQCPP